MEEPADGTQCDDLKSNHYTHRFTKLNLGKNLKVPGSVLGPVTYWGHMDYDNILFMYFNDGLANKSITAVDE